MNFVSFDEILVFLPKDVVEIIYSYYKVTCSYCGKDKQCRICEYKEWCEYWNNDCIEM